MDSSDVTLMGVTKMVPSANPVIKLCFVILVFLFLPPLFLSSCQGSAAEEDAPDAAAMGRLPEEEIRFTNGGTTLAGTIFWPASEVDCRAVVILAGSDRSKRGPLRIKLAEHFAAHGVAALVYDSPGTGGSTGNALLQSRDERALEALAAVNYLREAPDIRSTSVGLFGGSEGADVALMACTKDPEIAFAIAVSGSFGGSVLEVSRYSAEKKGYQWGLTLDEITQAITFKEIAFAFLIGPDIVEWSLIESRMKQWDGDTWAKFVDIAKQHKEKLTREQKEEMLGSLRHVVDQFKSQQWFSMVDIGDALQRTVNLDVDTFFRLLEEGPYSRGWEGSLCLDAARIRCPVLAIWGQEDSFLPPNQSATRLRRILAGSNHPNYEIEIFDNASHFLTKSGPASEFVPGYLGRMTTWLDKQVGSGDAAGP